MSTASSSNSASMLQSVVVPTRAFLPVSNPSPRTVAHAPLYTAAPKTKLHQRQQHQHQQEQQQIDDTNLAGLFAALQSNSALKAQLRAMLLSEDNAGAKEPPSRPTVYGNSSQAPVVVPDNDCDTDEEDFDVDVYMA